jgi:hypothetical protein
VTTLQYVVNATGNLSAFLEKAGLTADSLDRQLGDLSKRIATPEVDLKDTKFTLGMVNAAKRLDKLSAMVADPKVEVDTAKAQLEILRITAALDKLDAKQVTAKVKVDVDRSWLRRLGGLFGGGGGGLFGGAAQAGGAGSNAFTGFAGSLGQYGTPALYGGLGLLGAVLGPALLPTLLGGAIGGGGAFGAARIGMKDRATLQALQTRLAATTGTTAASRATRARLQDQIAAFQTPRERPILAIGAAAAAIPATAEATFFGALTGRPVIRTGGSGPGGHGQVLGQSFLQGLIPVFKQIDRFIKSIGPGLGDMFRASLPFLKLFVTAFEELAKTLLPVLTTSLKQMTPFLPIIGQGLVAVIQGLADMIKAIGPRGMEASARIFMNLCKVMGLALTVLGKVMNFLAIAVYHTAHAIHQQWDELRHRTADAFDRIRHDVARFGDWLVKSWIATGHMIEAAWNQVWHDTVGATIRGISSVISWFKTLPGRAVTALRGLGHGLAAFASAAFNEMLNAIQNVAGNIWHWLTGWVQHLPGFLKKLLGISSPSSVFYDIGKQMMMGLFHGIKDHAHHAANAAKSATGGFMDTGARSGNAAIAQQYAASLLSSYGWGRTQFGPLLALWNQESGWNAYAVNPSSGAYGIPQSLGHGHPYNLGDYKAQIIWGLNYIKNTPGYGSPAAAWAHEQAFNWYDRGGWLPPGLSLAMNATGRSERVLAPGEGSGRSVVINMTNYISSDVDADLVARKLAFQLDN